MTERTLSKYFDIKEILNSVIKRSLFNKFPLKTRVVDTE